MDELRWRKSSRSGATNGNCVEVARLEHGAAAIRDSKDPHQRVRMSAPAWRALLRTVRR